MKSFNQLDTERSGNHPFVVIVDGQEFEWASQYITGEELKKLAKLPADSELYLGVVEPWQSELISEEMRVDLARPEIEEFFVKKKLKITIDKVPFDWDKQFITGAQLKRLGNVNDDDDLFLDNSGKFEDELIEDNTRVNLVRPGIEHFYSKASSKEVLLIVNGTPKKWDKKQITFKELIILAYGTYNDSSTMVYTVGYEDGPKQNPEGSMTKSATVFVKNKMVFHATATDKS